MMAAARSEADPSEMKEVRYNGDDLDPKEALAGIENPARRVARLPIGR